MKRFRFSFRSYATFFFFPFWKVFVQKVRGGWVINTYIWDIPGDNFQFVCLLSIRSESLLFGGGMRGAAGGRAKGKRAFSVFVLKPSSKHM